MLFSANSMNAMQMLACLRRDRSLYERVTDIAVELVLRLGINQTKFLPTDKVVEFYEILKGKLATGGVKTYMVYLDLYERYLQQRAANKGSAVVTNNDFAIAANNGCAAN